MRSNPLCVRPACAAMLVALAGAAASPDRALAQDGELSVQVSPQVIFSGQNAQVSVLAHSPSTAYAFASSRFDVLASHPLWRHASAGTIVGTDVLGIDVGQAHAPQIGLYADPASPLRVWNGIFSPAAPAPALVEVKAEPADFRVYPSRLTGSSAPLEATGGSGYIFVNPLPVAGVLAAPGQGTRIHIQDDVVVDGQVITGNAPAPVRIGLLVPSVNAAREATTRLGFDEPPDTLTAIADFRETRTTWSGPVTLQSTATIGPPLAGQGKMVKIDFCKTDIGYAAAFLGGVNVAAKEVDTRGPIVRLPSTPDVIGVRAGPSSTRADAPRQVLAWTIQFDRPVPIQFFNGRVLTADTLVIEASYPGAGLAKVGPGSLVLDASGVEHMMLTPMKR